MSHSGVSRSGYSVSAPPAAASFACCPIASKSSPFPHLCRTWNCGSTQNASRIPRLLTFCRNSQSPATLACSALALVAGTASVARVCANHVLDAPTTMASGLSSHGPNVPRCGCRPRHMGSDSSPRRPMAWLMFRLAGHRVHRITKSTEDSPADRR